MKEEYKGILIHYANQWVKEFKPRIEEKIGIKLEGIVVKDILSTPEFAEGNHSDDYMFVTPYHRHRNTIFMNEKNYEDDYGYIPISVTHELAHLFHNYLMKEDIKKTKFLPLKIWKSRQYFNKAKAFREGFAEYMSLDNLINLYEGLHLDEEVKKTSKFFGSYRDFSAKKKPYAQGYKFFRKILSIVGEDKFLEVAKSPPISEIEVRTPLLYLLRKYPYQGIKNIPKFLKHELKTKILKDKYSLFNDFPITKKGSGKGKIVKAMPA